MVIPQLIPNDYGYDTRYNDTRILPIQFIRYSVGRYLQVLPGTCTYFDSGCNTCNDVPVLYQFLFLCVEPVTLGTLGRYLQVLPGACRYFYS